MQLLVGQSAFRPLDALTSNASTGVPNIRLNFRCKNQSRVDAVTSTGAGRWADD